MLLPLLVNNTNSAIPRPFEQRIRLYNIHHIDGVTRAGGGL